MAKDDEDGKVECTMNWEISHVIADRISVPNWAAGNVVEMLTTGDTIPFIARYRKERTGDMDVDKIRDVERNMEELKAVEAKVHMVLKVVKKQGKLTRQLLGALENSLHLPEVEALYAPYKPGNKGTLAERARALGLEPLALQYIQHPWRIDVNSYIKPGTKGLSSHGEVETGVKNILADVMTKDKEVIDLVRQLAKDRGIALESSEAKGLKKKLSEKSHDKELDKAYKYENYYNFRQRVDFIQPHQVLAINRGEEHKILSVTITYPQGITHRFSSFLQRQFLRDERRMPAGAISMVKSAIDDAFERMIRPQMSRQIRSELLKTARKSSIEVFAKNLKQLLLTQPCRGKTILGLDPGFHNGCKTAIVSETGKVMHTTVLYLRDHSMKWKILELIDKNRCSIIAIGDGSGCRETEKVVSDAIKESCNKVQYSIVRESGASIYSVTDVAKKDLPDLDPSLRSAVSIARRLLDPLAEYVKVDPKNIGVGQYQHDMPEKQLQTSLDSVVEECVSFVGVDINTASEHLLRRTAGLNATRAKNIVEWRETKGLFINRDQVRSVKGVGAKSYEQCAGFIRVHCVNGTPVPPEVKEEEPEATTSASGGKKRKAAPKKVTKAKKAKMSDQPNPLDITSIHPESYPPTERLLERIGLSASEVGHAHFIRKVEDFLRTTSVASLAEEFSVGEPTMLLITNALQQLLTYDFRQGYDKPLFRSGTIGFDALKVGEILTGKVENVTHFGAFVDVGVGESGLLHNSRMNGQNIQLGNRLEVKVISFEKDRRRFGLQFVKFV